MIRAAILLALTLAASAPPPARAFPLPEADPVVALGPIEDVIPVATPCVAPVEPRSEAITRTGTVSTYGPHFDGFAALPLPWGRGWRFTVCGPGGCAERVSNDTGPVRALGRIADLDVETFELVCGVPWRFGLCTATVTIEGRFE